MASLNHMYTQPRDAHGHASAGAPSSYHIETEETREKQRRVAHDIQHRLHARGLTEQQQRQCGAPHNAAAKVRHVKKQRKVTNTRHATETHNHLGLVDAEALFLDGIAAAVGGEAGDEENVPPPSRTMRIRKSAVKELPLDVMEKIFQGACGEAASTSAAPDLRVSRRKLFQEVRRSADEGILHDLSLPPRTRHSIEALLEGTEIAAEAEPTAGAEQQQNPNDDNDESKSPAVLDSHLSFVKHARKSEHECAQDDESDLGSPMPLQKTTTVSLEQAGSAATEACNPDSGVDEVQDDATATNETHAADTTQVVTTVAELKELLNEGQIDHAQFKDLRQRVKAGEAVTVPTSAQTVETASVPAPTLEAVPTPALTTEVSSSDADTAPGMAAIDADAGIMESVHELQGRDGGTDSNADIHLTHCFTDEDEVSDEDEAADSNSMTWSMFVHELGDHGIKLADTNAKKKGQRSNPWQPAPPAYDSALHTTTPASVDDLCQAGASAAVMCAELERSTRKLKATMDAIQADTEASAEDKAAGAAQLASKVTELLRLSKAHATTAKQEKEAKERAAAAAAAEAAEAARVPVFTRRQVVQARFDRGSSWHNARIVAVHVKTKLTSNASGSGAAAQKLYDIEYDSGQREYSIPAIDPNDDEPLIRRIQKHLVRSSVTQTFTVRDRVQMKLEGRVELGRVSCVRQGGQYDVLLDNGRTEMRVPTFLIQPADPAIEAAAEQRRRRRQNAKSSAVENINGTAKVSIQDKVEALRQSCTSFKGGHEDSVEADATSQISEEKAPSADQSEVDTKIKSAHEPMPENDLCTELHQFLLAAEASGERIEDSFRRFDADGNGVITYSELASGLQALGWRCMTEATTNKDGDPVPPCVYPHAKAELHELLRRFDKNNNEMVSLNEFIAFVRQGEHTDEGRQIRMKVQRDLDASPGRGSKSRFVKATFETLTSEDLLEAAFTGDTERVELVLRRSPKLRNRADVCEAACRAARRDHVSVLRMLFEKGYAKKEDFRLFNGAGFSATGMAAYHGARASLQWLSRVACVDLRAPAAVRLKRTPLDPHGTKVEETALELAKKHQRWQTARYITQLIREAEQAMREEESANATDDGETGVEKCAASKTKALAWAERLAKQHAENAEAGTATSSNDKSPKHASDAAIVSFDAAAATKDGAFLVRRLNDPPEKPKVRRQSTGLVKNAEVVTEMKEELEQVDEHRDAGQQQRPDTNTFLGLESAALRERRQMEARTRRERLAYATQIGSILKLHNPKLIDSLPDLLRRHEGREKELLSKIESRYGLRSAGFKANPLPKSMARRKLWVTLQQEQDAERRIRVKARSEALQAESNLPEGMRRAAEEAAEAKRRHVAKCMKELEVERKAKTAAKKARHLSRRRSSAHAAEDLSEKPPPPLLAPCARVHGGSGLKRRALAVQLRRRWHGVNGRTQRATYEVLVWASVANDCGEPVDPTAFLDEWRENFRPLIDPMERQKQLDKVLVHPHVFRADGKDSMPGWGAGTGRALKQRASRIELLGRESDGGFDEGAFRHRSTDEATLNAVKEKILLEGHATEAVGYGGEGAAWMQHQGESSGKNSDDHGADLAAKIATTKSATLRARNRRQGTDALETLERKIGNDAQKYRRDKQSRVNRAFREAEKKVKKVKKAEADDIAARGGSICEADSPDDVVDSQPLLLGVASGASRALRTFQALIRFLPKDVHSELAKTGKVTREHLENVIRAAFYPGRVVSVKRGTESNPFSKAVGSYEVSFEHGERHVLQKPLDGNWDSVIRPVGQTGAGRPTLIARKGEIAVRAEVEAQCSFALDSMRDELDHVFAHMNVDEKSGTVDLFEEGLI